MTRPDVMGLPTAEEPSGRRSGWARLLPWRRRPRRIRRSLAAALVLTALLGVATFGGLNFVAGRDLLVRGTEAQLVAVGATRADTIQAGTSRLVGEISAAAADLSMGVILRDFTEAFDRLAKERLSRKQRAELREFYQRRLVDPLNEAGLGPFDTGDLLPDTPASRWLQYHYTVRPVGEPPPVDPGDGTRYSTVNAEVEEYLRDFSATKAGGDVLLIDRSGRVVYSLEKRNDLGTDLTSGPYANGVLARIVTQQLSNARVGDTLLTDFSISQTGRAALFAVTAVRGAERVVGALAVEIPVSTLNAVTSAGEEWEAVGLEDGDAYVVGPDGVLQTEPRAWLEDPAGYLDRLRGGDEESQAEARLIELFGSPVGVRVIDTDAVRSAVDGEDFRGVADNDEGDSTFTASESFSAGGQQFIVVTEVPRSVALGPLLEYVRQILLVLAIVLPIVALVGLVLSRTLTKPIPPTVAAAEAIADGEREPDLDMGRRDEFGALGRQLVRMAHALADHEKELAAEYERTRELLLAVLPRQLVDDNGTVLGTGDAADRATVLAVNLVPREDHQDQEQTSDALQRTAALMDQIADETDVQRVRVAADRSLFLAGMESGDAGADAALRFVDQLCSTLDEDSVVALELHLGLSTGPVATGVLQSGALTFGAWGDPVRRALALAALADADSALVDVTTFEVATPGAWPLVGTGDTIALDDEPTAVYALDVTPQTSSDGGDAERVPS